MVGFDWKRHECRTDGAVGQCQPGKGSTASIAIPQTLHPYEVEEILLAGSGRNPAAMIFMICRARQPSYAVPLAPDVK